MAAVPEGMLLAPGFGDPVLDAQRSFRAVLDAMARPGTVHPLPVALEPPAPLVPAAAALCLALADMDTPVWLDPPAAAAAPWLRFHCGCPVAEDAAAAAFAVIAEGVALPPLDGFALGDPYDPHHAATVIIQVAALRAGAGRRLTGPGIEAEARLDIAGLDPRFWPQWAANNALFPQGIDVIFAAGGAIAALPRTTRAEG